MTDKIVKSIPLSAVMRERGYGYFDPIIACDADGVLVDLETRMEEHAAQMMGDMRYPVNLATSRTYFHHRDPGTRISKDEIGHLLRELMNQTRGGIGDLDFYPGAIKAIKNARKAGISTRVLTSLPGAFDSSPDNGQSYAWGTARELRTQQFLTAGVIQEENHIVFCDAHEKPDWMLDRLLLHIPLLIDDRASTLISASVDHGLIAVGIESERTLTIPAGKGLLDRYGVTWFNSLSQAMPHILTVFNKMERKGLLRGYDSEV